MNINITQLLLDIKTHVVNTVKNDLEDRMKDFINNLIEKNKDQINNHSLGTIKEQLEGKEPLDILKLSKKFISKEDWMTEVGDDRVKFLAQVEKYSKPGYKGGDGNLNSTINTASQSLGDAIKIAPQPFVAAFERYVKTYESANLKLPQDPARQVSDAILALVNTAVQTRRQNTIDSLIAIAKEGTDTARPKIIKADSFRGTVKMKIEEKIINDCLQDWILNKNNEMNIIMNESFSQKVKERVIENKLIHKSYKNNPQVIATIDRYFDKLEKVGSKSDPKVKNDPIRNNLKKIGEAMGISKEKKKTMKDRILKSVFKNSGGGPKNENQLNTEKLSSEEFDKKFKEQLSATVSEALGKVTSNDNDNDNDIDVIKRANQIQTIMNRLEDDKKIDSIIDTNNPLYTEYKKNVCGNNDENKEKNENDIPMYCISKDTIKNFIEYVHTIKVKEPRSNENVNKIVLIDFKLLQRINDIVHSPEEASFSVPDISKSKQGGKRKTQKKRRKHKSP